MTTDWTPWKQLAPRYQTVQPRRMLALDGGGIRGLISLQVLAKLERLLAEHYARQDGTAAQEFRLCQFFDYVAGTSTGAIIAAGIARGLSVAEILAAYRVCGKIIFKKRSWHQRWRSVYDHGPLEQELQRMYSVDANLQPEHLQTLLMVVTRNTKTDSPWPITSNPAAKFNAADRADCNLRLPLWKLVRASTAAPVYFAHQRVDLAGDDATQSAYFVDGGTTAYNNPAFLLFRMATDPHYRLCWQRGERKLLLVSLGAGTIPAVERQNEGNILTGVKTTIAALLAQTTFDQDVNCRSVGRCAFGPKLDDELDDLVPRSEPLDPASPPIPLSQDCGRDFLYVRYNVDLTADGLSALGLSRIEPRRVAALDAVAAMPELEEIGQALGRQVQREHLGTFPETPLFRGEPAA